MAEQTEIERLRAALAEAERQRDEARAELLVTHLKQVPNPCCGIAGPCRMDAEPGPVCHCGKLSTEQGGFCGDCAQAYLYEPRADAAEAREARLREVLAGLLTAIVHRSAGVAAGPMEHEPYALCTVCGNEGDSDAPHLNHDAEEACGKAAAALAPASEKPAAQEQPVEPEVMRLRAENTRVLDCGAMAAGNDCYLDTGCVACLAAEVEQLTEHPDPLKAVVCDGCGEVPDGEDELLCGDCRIEENDRQREWLVRLVDSDIDIEVTHPKGLCAATPASLDGKCPACMWLHTAVQVRRALGLPLPDGLPALRRSADNPAPPSSAQPKESK